MLDVRARVSVWVYARMRVRTCACMLLCFMLVCVCARVCELCGRSLWFPLLYRRPLVRPPMRALVHVCVALVWALQEHTQENAHMHVLLCVSAAVHLSVLLRVYVCCCAYVRA